MNENGTPWTVLLVGGASGTGKSSLSYPLARLLGVTVTEIDDLHAAVHRLTTAEQQPVLHYWDTHAETALSAEEILKLHRSVCRVLEPALEVVIANHAEAETPSSSRATTSYRRVRETSWRPTRTARCGPFFFTKMTKRGSFGTCFLGSPPRASSTDAPTSAYFSAGG